MEQSLVFTFLKSLVIISLIFSFFAIGFVFMFWDSPKAGFIDVLRVFGPLIAYLIFAGSALALSGRLPALLYVAAILFTGACAYFVFGGRGVFVDKKQSASLTKDFVCEGSFVSISEPKGVPAERDASYSSANGQNSLAAYIWGDRFNYITFPAGTADEVRRRMITCRNSEGQALGEVYTEKGMEEYIAYRKKF